MADGRRYGLSTQLDIQQILLEAQNRWLRPPEICEILKNSRNFRIAPEPPNKPPSGSLFLFDRKVLRYFRKDGHNWRKKKDGKTVREAHERLKAGSVDVLHCYYAHGEENENFQRRSYWMLEEDLMHIVLVHYREVKGNKTNFSRIRHPEETSPTVQLGSPVSSNYLTDLSQVPSQTVDTSSLTHASEYDDAESDNHQASSRYRSFLDLQQPEDGPVMNNQIDAHLLNSYFPASYPYDQSDYHGKQLNFHELNSVPLGQDNVITGFNDARFGFASQGPMKKNGVASWEEGLGNSATGFQSAPFQPAVSSTQSANSVGIPKENALLGQFFTDEQSIKHEIIANSRGHAQWQIASEDDSSNVSMWSMDHRNLDSELSTGFQEQKGHYVDVDDHDTFSTNSDQENSSFMPNDIQLRLSNTEVGGLLTSDLDVNDQSLEENISHFSARHQLKDCSTTGEEGLKKFDSFSRWMSKELGEMDGPTQSTSQIDWDTVENGNVVEDSSMSPQVHPDYLLTPSLSKDQLFSILDFSPNWAYTGMETKVLITGKFLKDKNDVQNCKWSCMFGEVEVPAEVLADGVLRCCAPVHAAGRVPFYVTCSNRLACSEIREFEYLVEHTHNVDTLETSDGSTNEIRLRVRLGKLLSLDSISYPNLLSSTVDGITYIRSKISSLLRENDDEWFDIERLTAEEEFSPGKVKEQLLQKILKEKLHAWLLQKVAEDGKGPCVLDKEGQGVIHLAAALGYDWAIAPTIVAGVHINFRDVRGWTAIHWAAFCGRERTVALLVSLGGNPGALTDPTPKFSSGSTPADLASSNGHKGIAGYLAESSLTSHLADLTLKETLRNGDASEIPSVKAFQTVGEWSATRFNDGDIHDRLSLKDSLTAVRNAAQAAARIHEVYRVHSFHRKQLIECGDDKYGMSEERALSLISIKSNKSGQHDEPIHTAAIRIQNKFRGWKGRKEFLITRQRIIKIQAHVRGHQVRKQYRKVIWSVGIVEKAILRWRRKGSGLRGFRSEGLVERTSMQSEPTKDDDYDFLKVGRKQTEERLEKALARVRSMVQYPEARDQYQRLLNVVTEFQETKVLERLMNGPEEDVEVDDMIELEQLLADDTFMSMASESDLGSS